MISFLGESPSLVCSIQTVFLHGLCCFLFYYIYMQFLVGCKLHFLVVCAMTMKLNLIQSNG